MPKNIDETLTKYFDCYRHMNESGLNIPVTIDDIVELLVKENYGAHRMVCAIAREQKKKFPNSELAQALFEVANKFTM